MNGPWPECARTIARKSKSFALAARLLPPAQRHAAIALYAWCRRCDDAIDSTDPPDRPAALARLGAELEQVYSNREPNDRGIEEPIVAFRFIAQQHSIPIEYPRLLLEGMALDVAGARYATTAELLGYCHRVAGVVGLMMCHVLGISSDTALPRAAHLGIAMQLTNICRDVREDWEQGRLYLPAELLTPPIPEAANGSARAPLPRRAVQGAARELLDVADRYYRSADEGLAYLTPRCAAAIRAARMVYAAIGAKIARRGYDVLEGRTVVSGGRKIWLAASALAKGAGHWSHGPEVRSPRVRLEEADAIRLA